MLLGTNNPLKYISFKQSIFFNLCFVLAVLFIYLYLYRKLMPADIESFNQKEPFELKVNDQIYDDTFIELYDSLHNVKKRCSNELFQVLKITQPSNNSVFLDIGSGTGYAVHELNQAGYTAYGLENSHLMISYSNNLYPNSHIEKGTALDSMAFDKSTFTHIMCNYFTIYQFGDKSTFFRNCYFWLKPNGYLVLHLVDKEKFTKMIPHDTHEEVSETNTHRIVENNTIFKDFKYTANVKIPKNKTNKNVEVIETFTESSTKHIRQNETHLTMESIDQILTCAQTNGFIIHAKVNMSNMNNDQNQYLYFLERTL
jgi:ubiquinone/menaquinone biosynthesis C-methylase UbiE